MENRTKARQFGELALTFGFLALISALSGGITTIIVLIITGWK